jgi:hypothetical protein
MTVRLSTVARDVVELVECASDKSRRTAAILAAEFAVDRAALDDPRVNEALEPLRNGRTTAIPERSAVEAFATALDDRQWDLQEKIASGDATPKQHLAAFVLARAAWAVYYAGDIDARIAALEAIYEASTVVDDLDELRSQVVPVLS